jgi:hypothetical protein
MRSTLSAAALALALLPSSASANLPDAISATGETLVATVHAVGAQLYECRFDSAGNLLWHFREPIATLFMNGTIVGQHYAGPSWEMSDGATLRASVVAHARAASADDIPLLKLAVTARRGTGRFADVTTIQRINTKGGTLEGSCPWEGALRSAPYTADYAFYRRRG